MAQRIRIECINKTDRMNAYERIKSIGGRNADGSIWRLPLEDAIIGVEIQKYDFFVIVDGYAVKVVISKSAYGHKYLKTLADGEMPNNLLSLPECT
ncbi:MAG: DUF3892 domain-containing protein [Hyphomicrobiaceae bacterium]